MQNADFGLSNSVAFDGTWWLERGVAVVIY